MVSPQFLHIQHLSTMILPFPFLKFWLFLKLNMYFLFVLFSTETFLYVVLSMMLI